MSTIKFLYKSQYLVDDKVIEGSEHTVTGGAVYTALQNVQVNTLFETGYFTDGIVGFKYQHRLTYANKLLQLDKGSNLFFPNGINEETGEFKFKKVTTEYDISANKIGLDKYNSALMVTMNETTGKYEFVASTIRIGVSNTGAVQLIFAQDEDPFIRERSIDDGTIWWDTKNNVTKIFSIIDNQQKWVDKEFSLPLGIISLNAGVVMGIVEDFITCGYVGDYFFINPTLTYIVPEGRTPIRQSTVNTSLLQTTDVICGYMWDIIQDPVEDFKFYITNTGELIAPRLPLAFDRELGYFVDEEGNTYSVCEVATASSIHHTKNADDPICVGQFHQRQPINIADQDDIENLIAMIGSSAGLTIDDLTALIELTRQNLDDKFTDLINSLEFKVEDNFVHLTGDETIEGIKTFKDGIVTNMVGIATQATTTPMVSTDTAEMIPVGIKVLSGKAFEEYTDNERSKLLTQTTVRISKDKVKAKVFEGQATSCIWADLAEIYKPDQEYPVGTLVKFGGDEEITAGSEREVHAVISDKPAYLMNSEAEGLPVAMTGRTPVRVVGKIKKGDPITGSAIAGVGRLAYGNMPVIARALEDKDFDDEGLLMCVVNIKL